MELAGKALNAWRNTTPTVNQSILNEWLLFKLGAVLAKPMEPSPRCTGTFCGELLAVKICVYNRGDVRVSPGDQKVRIWN